MHFAIRTADNLDNPADLADTALGVREDSQGRGQEDHLVVVRRVGKGQSVPGRSRVEDFRSSFWMRNLSCRRTNTNKSWFVFNLLHPQAYQSHFRLLSRGLEFDTTRPESALSSSKDIFNSVPGQSLSRSDFF